MGNKITADRIKKALKNKDMTQKELAENIGISQAAMSRYMSGSRLPRVNILKDMAECLSVTPDWLLGLDDEKSYDVEYELIKKLLYRNRKYMSNETKLELIAIIMENS